MDSKQPETAAVGSAGVVVLRPPEFANSTTGDRQADQEINDAVEAALVRVQPILRDILRHEIKQRLETAEPQDNKAI